MSKKMLIDASHPEETRVVIVDGTRVEELDFESAAKRQLRGNLYLARVTRVEPSLQAAFVEYGGNRHGFLAFSEIHPDYYQIPYEDRMALLEAEEAEALEDKAEEEKASEKPRKAAKSKSKSKTKSEKDDDETEEASSEDTSDDDESDKDDASEDTSAEDATDDADEEVADEQEKTAQKRRTRSSRHRYKMQEVIKRGQILLIQVVKEERGNKGAAMTTYLSLAGRYCVLMPNTPKGGGISRKIANGSDRKRLKSVVSEFEVPQGMGVIVRTAGAKRTKLEIKRDYDYLSRLWETVRATTLTSIAPALIHEEGNLVKRSIRDLYNKDIEEILVQGDDAYKSAKDFIKMLMPSHAKNVKAYKESIPLYLRYQVESQIENSLDSVVQLKSGGYLVIHPTEALVSVDVNSGRSTKERNVERTALKTNLEAADEVARQMRLRDLAGLVVIDFIDMDEYRNNRSVEKRMRDALSRDRARVQAGKISQFGLMEISRQRRRRSLLEGSTTSCPHCQGVGRKRTVESSALRALRAVHEKAARGQTRKARLTVDPEVAAFILNHKREELNDVQTELGMYTVVEADSDLLMPEYGLTVLEKADGKNTDPLAEIELEAKKAAQQAARAPKKKKSSSDESSDEKDDDAKEEQSSSNDEERDGKKRRRRGRRGGRKRKPASTDGENKSSETDDADAKKSDGGETDKADSSAKDTETDTTEPKKSRRRRAPKRKADPEETPAVEAEATEEKPKKTRSRRKKASPATEPTKTVEDTPKAKEAAEDKPKPKPKRSTTRRKAPTRKPADDAETKEKSKDDSKDDSKAAITEVKKPTAKRKPRKTAAKAKAATPAKKAAPVKKAAPAKKTASTKKAPVKKKAAEPVSKAPAAKIAEAPKPVEVKAEAKIEPKAELEAKTPSKRGWWSRKSKKD